MARNMSASMTLSAPRADGAGGVFAAGAAPKPSRARGVSAATVAPTEATALALGRRASELSNCGLAADFVACAGPASFVLLATRAESALPAGARLGVAIAISPRAAISYRGAAAAAATATPDALEGTGAAAAGEAGAAAGGGETAATIGSAAAGAGDATTGAGLAMEALAGSAGAASAVLAAFAATLSCCTLFDSTVALLAFARTRSVAASIDCASATFSVAFCSAFVTAGFGVTAAAGVAGGSDVCAGAVVVALGGVATVAADGVAAGADATFVSVLPPPGCIH